MSKQEKPIEVALAVLFDEKGRFLMNSRPKGKAYEGFWEFPGGKVEDEETLDAAIKRELTEELGVKLDKGDFIYTELAHYPHATVRLHFCVSDQWEGKPISKENQEIGFFTMENLPSPILPETEKILKLLIDLCESFLREEASRKPDDPDQC